MHQEYLAFTHIQLLNQLASAGYGATDLELVFEAYQYCVELCDGFQPCGKPFISHLIRTASILVTLNQEAPVIGAGLLHAIYEFGDFGDGSRGIASWKQSHVKARMGVTVERHIQAYSALHWTDQTVKSVYDRLPSLTPIERTVLLIRLSNELEQSLDLEPLYRSDYEEKIQKIRIRKDSLVDMANQLGYSSLANQLDRAFTTILSTSISTGEDLRNSKLFSHQSARSSLNFFLKKRFQGFLKKWGLVNLHQKSLS